MQKHPLDIIEKMNVDTTDTWKNHCLELYKDNDNWLKTLTYTYDPKYTFGIKKLDIELNYIKNKRKITESEIDSEIHVMFGVLDKLHKREITGNRAKEMCRLLINGVSCKTGELFYWIINKDLKCGIGKRTIIKAYGSDIVWKPPYMGAVTFSVKKVKRVMDESNGLVFVEDKADGLYGAIVLDYKNNDFYIESRSGLLIHGADIIIDRAKELFTKSCVLNGEIMLKGYPRHKANGMVASIQSLRKSEAQGKSITKKLLDFELDNKISLHDAEQLLYVKVWDWLPLSHYKMRHSCHTREYRMMILEEHIKNNDVIKIINYKRCRYYDEVVDFFQEQLANELEGVIVKTPQGEWKDTKPWYQVKMKIDFTCDLRIIDFIEGEENTKYKGSLGSLVCASKDGKLITGVSGMTDRERASIWANKDKWLDTIIEVKCNGLSKDSSKDTYSMLYANCYKPDKRIIRRDDKLEANTLQEIMDIEEVSKYG